MTQTLALWFIMSPKVICRAIELLSCGHIRLLFLLKHHFRGFQKVTGAGIALAIFSIVLYTVTKQKGQKRVLVAHRNERGSEVVWIKD